MIVRSWKGEASRAKAPEYRRHFELRVLPHLRSLAGFRGAWLLQQEKENLVRFQALTRWDSMEAIRAFAGQSPARAVVEPEARAALDRFDETVEHFELSVEGAPS